ncbi:DNA damage-inducible protein 1 [Lentinula edodes]|uniref:DNA damage-inducible protein 1 n=1 Tax=Lentinula edodes TaxID=5353 RepID=A0A1Q3EB54_LENED|nr:DNA damage-inducible protein 1 [Lentinula edodes]
MNLTFVTDLGETFSIEIDPDMELETVMVLLEAESGIPTTDQSISYQNNDLTSSPSSLKRTLRQLNVSDSAMLSLRRKAMIAPSGQSVDHDSETMRLQLLGSPDLMSQLEQHQPEIASAARNNPARFAELLRQTRTTQQQTADLEAQQELSLMNADPFDVEAQRKIEERIRQQAVLDNMAHAIEWSPESFGRVTMLYIDAEVNGTPVKAFVDSGAQQTIISPEYAEKCGIMRLLDTRFAGIARGVGTAKILGRVHSTQFKVADLHLPCSFTIMEGRDVDLLLGLDMLKSYQASIDLEKNVLRIQGREIPFLAEHQLPAKARGLEEEEEALNSALNASRSAGPSTGSQHFPGGGATLGGTPGPRLATAGAATPGASNIRAAPRSPATPSAHGPASRSSASSLSHPASGARQTHPEANIAVLMDLGATREIAISMLDATGGNVDAAASLMF